jgi:hypothetical protein
LDTINPVLTWDSGDNPNATTLRIQVAPDSDFTQGVWNYWSSYRTTGVHASRFPLNLAPSTTYYWRAWLVCDDDEGLYTEVWSFTTGSSGVVLPGPALTAPADGSTLSSLAVTLQWSDVDGAVEYVVYWQKAGGSMTYYRWATETQEEITRLEANTTYEWWVAARNDYAIGKDSETWQFATPAESLSISSQDLDCSFSVDDDGAVAVEGQGDR